MLAWLLNLGFAASATPDIGNVLRFTAETLIKSAVFSETLVKSSLSSEEFD